MVTLLVNNRVPTHEELVRAVYESLAVEYPSSGMRTFRRREACRARMEILSHFVAADVYGPLPDRLADLVLAMAQRLREWGVHADVFAEPGEPPESEIDADVFRQTEED